MKKLIIQFPDVSMKSVEKFQLSRKRLEEKFRIIEQYPNELIRFPGKSNLNTYDKSGIQFLDDTKSTSENSKMSQQDYDDLFRKRHVKLVLILFGCFVIIYLLFAQSYRFFEWILQ